MKGKITALFAVLVLSLAATGIAYAAWTHQLNVIGIVETGTLDMEITSLGADYGTTGLPALGGGTVTATVTGDTVNLVATNAYPGQIGYVFLHFENTGSLPAEVTSITWTQVPAGDYANDISWAYSSYGGAWIPAVGDLFGVIPGAERTCILEFTVLTDAVQGGTYTYSLTFDFGVYTP